jgi:hypothetical protein
MGLILYQNTVSAFLASAGFSRLSGRRTIAVA